MRNQPPLSPSVAAGVLAVVQTLAGSGIIAEDIAATVTRALDPTTGGWLIPVIVGLVTRFFVWGPKSVERLQQG